MQNIDHKLTRPTIFKWILILSCRSFSENSKGLHRVLENPHVRDILKMVDRSPNPGEAMRAAMLEPIFVEFADECFKIIEPPKT